MKLVSGSSNPKLAQAIADQLKIESVPVEITRFPNGEKRVWINDPNIRGENVVVVQSFSEPCDEHIIEFLLMVDALERLGVRHVNAVIPWLGYSLQDKVFRQGEPISAKVVANLISNSYVKRAFLLDLHNTSTPGFFSIPTQHISGLELFTEHSKNNFDLKNCVVASPDFGGLKRARQFATELDVPLVNIDKHRDLKTGKVTAVGLHGETEGKTALIFDDIIVSGGTVVEAARLLKEQGAKEVIFMATHGPLMPQAYAKFADSDVDQVIVTNSVIPVDEAQEADSVITRINVAPLLAEKVGDWI